MMLNHNIRQVLDAAGAPYCCVIRPGYRKLTISIANKTFRELFPFSAVAPDSQDLDRVPGFQSPELIKTVNEVFDRDKTATTEIRQQVPGGEMKSWKLTCIPLADTRGQSTSVLLFLTDAIAEDHTDAAEQAAYHQRLIQAQQLAQLGYWELDLKDNKIFWNREMYLIWGHDPSQPAPDPQQFRETIHPADRIAYDDFIRRMAGSGSLERCEFRIITPAGLTKYVNVQLSTGLSLSGLPRYIKGTVQDMTVQKEQELKIIRRSLLLETTLAFNQALLEDMSWADRIVHALGILGRTLSADQVYYFEHITDTYTGNSSVLLQSRWYAGSNQEPGLEHMLDEFLGYSLVTLAGKQYMEMHTQQLPAGVLRSKAEQQGIQYVQALPVFVKGLFHGFLAISCHKQDPQWSDAEYTFLASITNSLTIAVKKQIAEESVRNSQQQFRSLVNNIPGITYRCLLDEYRTMLFISDEAERLLGYKSEDFIYNQLRSFVSVIHPDDVAEGGHHAGQELSSNGRFTSSYRLLTAAGDIVWIEDRGIATYDADGKLLWIDGVMLDVTDKKQPELREHLT